MNSLVRRCCKLKKSIKHSKYLFSTSHLSICSMADDRLATKPVAAIDGTDRQLVTEGKASIVQPASVFYNPVQEFNRDLTIAIISEYAEEHIQQVREKRRKREARDKMENGGDDKMENGGDDKMEVTSEPEGDREDNIEVKVDHGDLVAGVPHDDGVRILEGLSASGLRSMRFGLEIPGVKKIIANDFDIGAYANIQENIQRNNLEGLVEASHGDAALLMYQNKSVKDRFDVIDLDPYGSAVPFLDGAVQAVSDGGLLCITCTDAAVLCGNAGEKCFANYGSISLRSKFCHEMGLRIILRAIESHANKYGRYIVPLVSLSIDFYFRVFVKVYTGAYKAKFSGSKTGLVYHCTGCGSYTIQPMSDIHPTKGANVKFTPARGPPVSDTCEHCNSKHQIGGPIYISSLHDPGFIDKIIMRTSAESDKFGTYKRIEGMLSMAREELDLPLYYESDGLFMVVHCMPMTIMKLRSAVLNAGYKVSFSHACKNSLKTDAPNGVIWDIIRAWVADNPVKENRLVPGSVSANILNKKPNIEVNFNLHEAANPLSRSKGLVRWQDNPEKDWGPKARAKRMAEAESVADKRRKNQGKRKKKEVEDENHSSEEEIEKPINHDHVEAAQTIEDTQT